jgi:3-hydroxyisobutyrate dehydrogenase-like beta-hydroxyacid dehydrogenase
MMAQERLGFIGVGRMGGPMATRLLDAGYELIVHDTNERAVEPFVARGAQRAASAKAVADAVELVLVSLPTPTVVEAVALGPSGIADGSRVKFLVDLSTSGPRTAIAVAEGLVARGITAVDSPVSGGIAGAVAGTLAVMLACPAQSRERLTSVLGNLGKVFFIGERPGMGQTMKLANNLLSTAALAISSEALVMGVKSGLDPKVMIDVINAGSGRNSATQDKFPKSVLPRTFDFGFATGLLYKDVKLCLEHAESLGVPMIVGSAVRELLGITKAMQGFESDFTTMVKCVETWAGVEVKG